MTGPATPIGWRATRSPLRPDHRDRGCVRRTDLDPELSRGDAPGGSGSADAGDCRTGGGATSSRPSSARWVPARRCRHEPGSSPGAGAGRSRCCGPPGSRPVAENTPAPRDWRVGPATWRLPRRRSRPPGQLSGWSGVRGRRSPPVAEGHFERAHPRPLLAAPALRHAGLAAKASNNLASIAHLRGKLTLADELYRSALLVYRREGDHLGVAQTEHNLGLLLRMESRYAEALAHSGARGGGGPGRSRPVAAGHGPDGAGRVAARTGAAGGSAAGLP